MSVSACWRVVHGARCSVAGALLFAALLAPPARADEAEAKAEFVLAKRLIAGGNRRGAIEHLERAYQGFPSPIFLYNIGLQYFALSRAGAIDDRCRALDHYRRYQRDVLIAEGAVPPADEKAIDEDTATLEAMDVDERRAAIAWFQRWHQEARLPELRFDIGEEYRLLGAAGTASDAQSAVESFRAYLVEYEQARHRPPPDEKSVRQKITELEARVRSICLDGARDGDESDIDCGGASCRRCDEGKRCGGDGDCASGVCRSGACQAPTCTDGVRNGREGDVDCGGPGCPRCGDDRRCADGAQCASGVCASGACRAPTCSDRVANGAESDVDCGGPCPRCSDGRACEGGGSCASGVCAGGTCQVATCSDGLRNGAETDRDCGGPCAACDVGRACGVDGRNCLTGVCRDGVCGWPRTREVAGGVLVGGGGLIAAGGAALVLLAIHAADVARSASTVGDHDAMLGSANSMMTAGAALLGVGGAALIAGVVALAAPRSHGELHAWWITPTASGLAVGGTFE